MDPIQFILDNIMWLAMLTGIIGLWFNSDPSMRGKMISYEVWIVANILWVIGGIYTNNPPIVLFNLVCIGVSIRGIYTHIYLADVEAAYNKSMLELPEK
jgi:hypothetical protein